MPAVFERSDSGPRKQWQSFDNMFELGSWSGVRSAILPGHQGVLGGVMVLDVGGLDEFVHGTPLCASVGHETGKTPRSI